MNIFKTLIFQRPKMSWYFAAAGLITGSIALAELPAPLSEAVPLATRPAIAQVEVTPDEIGQYAQAVLEIDGHRAEAYTQIKNLLLSVNFDIGDVSVSCSNTQQISKVPRAVRQQVRNLFVGYCNRAQDIVQGTGLSPRRFNEITSAHQENNALSERIQQELIRLQQDK